MRVTEKPRRTNSPVRAREYRCAWPPPAKTTRLLLGCSTIPSNVHDDGAEHTVRNMRTYSHVLLTQAAASRLTPDGGPEVSAWAAAGAALPDLPAACGVFWLAARRQRGFTRREFCREACEKGPFGAPDAALHSALPVAALLALHLTSGAGGSRARLASLLGGELRFVSPAAIQRPFTPDPP